MMMQIGFGMGRLKDGLRIVTFSLASQGEITGGMSKKNDLEGYCVLVTDNQSISLTSIDIGN